MQRGYQFSHKIAVYGAVGLGVTVPNLIKGIKSLLPKIDVGVSWGFYKYVSLISSIGYCYTFGEVQATHHVVALIGIQWNSAGFYKND